MAVADTFSVLNYSGVLYAKSDNNTRLLDAILTRGRTTNVARTGVRKVASTEFDLYSSYDIPAGSQPAISETASLTATVGAVTTRSQETNVVQIFQEAVEVSYLKQASTGSLAGLNIAGQNNNVSNETDFQIQAKLLKMKKDLNYTLINGVYQKATSAATAAKTKGLIAGITDNAEEYANAGFDKTSLNTAISAAMGNGFAFNDGRIELWVNPADLVTISNVYGYNESTFAQPASRDTAGVAIRNIMTDFGMLGVDYDKDIPAGTMLLLDMSQLAIAEMDYINPDGINYGCWFYEDLAKKGASNAAQIFGIAGIDYGAQIKHIKLTKAAGD